MTPPKNSHFSPALFRFLIELGLNNNRTWFLAHKPVYESDVKEAAQRFIVDVGPHLHAISKHLSADPRPVGGSLFRIYRDARFSRDKSPYKTHVGMHFPVRSVIGKNDPHAAGFYLHIEPGGCFAGGGIWHPEPPALAKIRTAIAEHPKQWAKARKGMAIEGDTLKRPPSGFDSSHPFIDDLKMKDYFVSVSFTDEQVTRQDFLRRFANVCRDISPLVAFLNKAMGMPW